MGLRSALKSLARAFDPSCPECGMPYLRAAGFGFSDRRCDPIPQPHRRSCSLYPAAMGRYLAWRERH